MRNLKLLLILPFLLLFLAGCGGDGPGKGREFVRDYHGHALHCIGFRGGTYGVYSGVVCDFERWHKETGR